MSPTLDYFASDITIHPFTNKSGIYYIDSTIGAGITIDPKVITKFLVTHFVYETPF